MEVPYKDTVFNVLMYVNLTKEDRVKTTIFIVGNTKYWIGGRNILAKSVTDINPIDEVKVAMNNDKKIEKIYGKLTKNS